MVNIGTPLKSGAKKVLLLGAGELGKEVVIELQRFGVEVIAVDRYQGAPAMQVAHRSHVINMLDSEELTRIIKNEDPDLIVPEIEAIATSALLELEKDGYKVVPNARATNLTMNREGIRRLASEELSIKTSPYRFADNIVDFEEAVKTIGLPCVVKPIMSSSGKGQSVVRKKEDVLMAWKYAQEGGRTGGGRVIIEGFIPFDYEITLLTVRHRDGTSFCEPIGHIQIDGDYRESWQPHPMSKIARERSEGIAVKITEALGGFGVFGVELFIKEDDVYFSEVSPRPHDTGLVTLISQELSEFALHARAILGLPIPKVSLLGSSASVAILGEGNSRDISFEGVDNALKELDTGIRLFGKPEIDGKRRLGVALARGVDLADARAKAKRVHDSVKIIY